MSSQHQVFKLIHCKFYPTKIHKPNGLGFEVPYLPNLSAQLANITSIATFTLDDFFNTDSLPQSLMWPKDPNRKSPSHSSLCQKSGDGVWALVLFWETPWFLDTPCPPPLDSPKNEQHVRGSFAKMKAPGMIHEHWRFYPHTFLDPVHLSAWITKLANNIWLNSVDVLVTPWHFKKCSCTTRFNTLQ